MSTTASTRTISFAGVAPRSRPKAHAVRGQITERDIEIATLIANGHTNKEIAARLNMGEQTVKNRVSDLYEKLSIRRRNPRVALALIVKVYGLELGPAPAPVRELTEAIQ